MTVMNYVIALEAGQSSLGTFGSIHMYSVLFLFQTHFTFRINKELIYSQYICQCCGKNRGLFIVNKIRVLQENILFFNTNISGIGVGYSLGEHSYDLCFT